MFTAEGDPGTTHAEGCETWGPKHWGCALAKIERQAREIERLREALEEIARLGCEDWPGGHVLTCSCNSCIAQRALASERDPVSRTPEIEDVLHRAGYMTADVPIPETSDSTRCRECGRKTETVSGVCIRCAVKCAPFVDPPERVSEQDDATEYRPWESMGITELAYWKRRYIEARMEVSEATALRDALQEIAESHDAGRHDGRPEPCPAHDAETMWAIATRVLASDEPGKGEGVP